MHSSRGTTLPQNNKSMLDCLNSELSGNARKILVMLLRGEKSESTDVSVLHSKARGKGERGGWLVSVTWQALPFKSLGVSDIGGLFQFSTGYPYMAARVLPSRSDSASGWMTGELCLLYGNCSLSGSKDSVGLAASAELIFFQSWLSTSLPHPTFFLSFKA